MTTEYSKYRDYKVSPDKTKELDIIKEIDKAVEQYNKDPDNHYFLRLLKGVRKAWF